ncbi:MAG: hypothetical protein ACXWTY_09595 [Methylobacter sp.]
MLKSLMIDECAEQRQSVGGFNAQKSAQLVRSECRQLLTLDEDFQRIDNKRFRMRPNRTRFEEQEDFDAEVWLMITEEVRKKHYPYLKPEEEEVQRTHLLMQQQAKSIGDKSVWRQWEPRLLPVSPYLMSYTQLGWAEEAASDLIQTHWDNNNIKTKLRIIRGLIVTERPKKSPYERHY